MTPARCALILKPHAHGSRPTDVLPWWGVGGLVGWGVATFLGPYLLPLVESILGTASHAAEHSAGHAHGETATLASWIAWGLAFAGGFVGGSLLTKPVDLVLGILLGGFNRVFDAITNLYGKIVAGLLRVSLIALLLYAGLMVLTYIGFQRVPVGFIPEQDQGYLVVNFQLPEGANIDRTERVVKEATTSP